MARSRSARSAQAARLPAPRYDDPAQLDRVRSLLGWTDPARAGRVRPGTDPLRPLLPDETVLFVPFVLAGLGLPMSQFVILLLEHYGVQLPHLTPHSVLLLSIFVHLCEMFVGVAPSLTLFRYYFVLRPTGRDVGIGGYYFQRRQGTELPFIQTFPSAHWDRWREDWVIVETETTDRLRPSTSAPAGDRAIWEEAPEMDERYGPVLTRIAELGTAGLTSIMVAADFLRRRIAPLQERTRPAWLYTGL